jgi:sugar phosphate isomerase/epimerase
MFSTPVDSIAGPIDVGSGFLIMRVNRIKFPESLPMDKVRDRVIELLRREKGKEIAVIKVYEAHTKAASTKDLKAACAPYGIVPVETGWTGDPKGEPVPPPVVQEALLLPAKEIGPVKTVGDVHYLYQVAAKEDSRIPALSEVREKVAAAVMREKRRAAAKSDLEKALSGAGGHAELEQRARKAGLSVTLTAFFPPFTGPYPESLPESAEIRKILISMSKKSPVHGKVVEASGRYLALAFVDDQRPDAKEWAAKKDAFIRAAAEQKRGQMMEAYIADRRAKVKVEINPEALK